MNRNLCEATNQRSNRNLREATSRAHRRLDVRIAATVGRESLDGHKDF